MRYVSTDHKHQKKCQDFLAILLQLPRTTVIPAHEPNVMVWPILVVKHDGVITFVEVTFADAEDPFGTTTYLGIALRPMDSRDKYIYVFDMPEARRAVFDVIVSGRNR